MDHTRFLPDAKSTREVAASSIEAKVVGNNQRSYPTTHTTMSESSEQEEIFDCHDGICRVRPPGDDDDDDDDDVEQADADETNEVERALAA
eukprot:scaffold20240_cov76-Amphora_coffeaeformis.AAC.1